MFLKCKKKLEYLKRNSADTVRTTTQKCSRPRIKLATLLLAPGFLVKTCSRVSRQRLDAVTQGKTRELFKRHCVLSCLDSQSEWRTSCRCRMCVYREKHFRINYVVSNVRHMEFKFCIKMCICLSIAMMMTTMMMILMILPVAVKQQAVSAMCVI